MAQADCSACFVSPSNYVFKLRTYSKSIYQDSSTLEIFECELQEEKMFIFTKKMLKLTQIKSHSGGKLLSCVTCCYSKQIKVQLLELRQNRDRSLRDDCLICWSISSRPTRFSMIATMRRNISSLQYTV